MASLAAYGALMASLPADLEAAKTLLSTATLRSKYGALVSNAYFSKVDTHNKRIAELSDSAQKYNANSLVFYKVQK